MAVELRIDGPVARLRLRRPEALNALDSGTVKALAAHVRSLQAREEVKVVVTSGEGRAFCAGSDLREMAAAARGSAPSLERQHAEMCQLLAELPQPTIALIRGYALGGGLGFALYHDFRVAAEDASFAMPEVPLGWTPPWAVGRLVSAVGPSQAKWLLLTGERIDGVRAAAIGLVHQAVPAGELEERGNALAAKLAAMPVRAVRETKRLIGRLSSADHRRWDEEAGALFASCSDTPEARAALEAFCRRL